ncbi:hypothetical protein I6N96_01755 [Enterococcus sp. BWM-S5]|uniref:Uncharacterized protein n=1 Tax=Enterococcus larvae TaxID=2794352 RepID=A0ABS4CEP5_9ENTE|nr:hypothetical protein [Enterococcus larvae]
MESFYKTIKRELINDLKKARLSDILIQDDGCWLVEGANGRVHILKPDGEVITIMNNISKSNLQKRIRSSKWENLTLEQQNKFKDDFIDYINWK